MIDFDKEREEIAKAYDDRMGKYLKEQEKKKKEERASYNSQAVKTKKNEPARRKETTEEAKKEQKKALINLKASLATPKPTSPYAPNQEKITLSNGQEVLVQRGASTPQTVDWGKVNDSTFGKAYTGVGTGLVNSFTGLPSFVASKVTGKDVDVSEKLGLTLKNDKAFQESGVKDTMAYQLGELGGEMLGYTIQGGVANPVTSKIGNAVAKSNAGRTAGQIIADAATVGTLQNLGIGYQEGLRGKELAIDVLKNDALDLGVGAGLTLVGKGLSKLIDVGKTVDLPTTKPQVEEVVEPAAKPAKTVDFEPKKATPMQVGKVTTVKNPYEGTKPTQTLKADRKTPEISRKTVEDVEYIKNNSEKNELKKILKERFGEPRTVDIDGMEEVKKIDLISKSSTDVGQEPTALDTASSLNVRVPQKDNPVKFKDLGADTLKASDDIETIRKKYGTFEGSKVPLRTKLGDVQQGAKTLYDSKLSTPEVKAAINEGIKDGDYWKNTVTNKSVLDEAEKLVSDNLEQATASFQSIMKEGKQGTSKDIAKGYKLAEAYIEKGDYDMVESILADVSAMESEAGRTLQAMKIFKNLTPAGKVKSALRTVEKLSASRGVEIKVNQELLDNIYKAANDAELAEANKAFALDVWNQIPANFSEKMNAWRYLAMLGNPKTHIRNVVGNMIYVPARVISDTIAAGIEKAFKGKVQRMSGGELSGSKAIFKGKYKDLAKDAYKRNKASLDATSSKYFETMRPQDSKVFNLKPVEGARKLNSKMLEGEDDLFKKLSFESAYAQYLKANNVTDLTEEIDKAATAYAYSQALRSTYQDPSKLADAISKFKRKLAPQQGDKGLNRLGKTVASQVAEATLPFVRTPINILKRGMEYSPAGLAGGIGKMIAAGSKGNVDEFLKGIELLASGITGTGLVALGMWARHRGLVNGSLGGWNKETAYKQTLGEQNYAVTVGDATITLDWASPLAMPFFVGVEAANVMDDMDDATFWKVFESMSTITEPAFEMSMLSGVESVFDTSYSGDTSKLSSILSNAVQGYASQFVPTLLGQIARTVTPDRKANISTAETKTERAVTKYLSKIANKIPGLTELTQPYIDQWGRTDTKHTTGDYVIAAVENFVSPGYISMQNVTAVDKEIIRINELTGDDAVIPYTPSDYEVTVAGEKYRMSNEEFTDFKKVAGQEKYKALEKLFKTDEYKTASNEEKVKKIKAVYDEAYDYAKEKFLVGTGKMTTEQYSYTTLTDTQKKAVDAKETTAVKIRKAQETVKKAGYDGNDNGVTLAMTLSDYDSATKKAYNQKNISDAAISKAERLQKAGVSTEDYYELYLKAQQISVENDGAKNISKAEAQKALAGEGYSGEEYRAILHALSNAKV